MSKTNKSVSVDDDILEHSKVNPDIKNFSDFVNNAYRDKYMNVEENEKKILEHQKSIDFLRIQNNKIKHIQNDIVTQEQLEWIKKEVPLRSERGAGFEGIYKFFINNFDREDLNRHQFKILIKKCGIDTLK